MISDKNIIHISTTINIFVIFFVTNRSLLTTQDLAQLHGNCGELYTDTIMSNCTFKVVFATNNEETAHIISGLAIDVAKGKPLFSAGEIIALPRDQQILLTEGQNPQKMKKLHYYDDPEFKTKVVAPVGA